MSPRVIVLIGMILTPSAAMPSFSSAHADLERSIPDAEAELGQSPAQIEMWFSEELDEGSTATVTGPEGDRVDHDDAAIDLFDPERKRLVVTLMPDLQAGIYTVAWTTVSGEDDDSHSGSFEFTVTTSATPVASPAESPVASPEASPVAGGTAQDDDEQAALAQASESDPAGPDIIDFLIALAVGIGAAALIFGFWLRVKPRREQKLDG